jgi:hypothetical protein
MNRIPEKLRNMGCKVKKKQCCTDYVSYLSAQYFVIFLEYGSCPVMPLFTSNSAAPHLSEIRVSKFAISDLGV